MSTATSHAATGSKSHGQILFMTELALMMAVIILMAFTPLGYIRTPFLSMTLIVVPVAVGAILLGPIGGMVLGATFGATSLYTAITAPSAMMAAFMMISPVKAAILCLVPRILEGLLTGLIFKGLHNMKATRGISYYAASLACPLLNTALFMGTIILFFYNCDYIQEKVTALGVSNPISFVVAFVGVQGLIEAAGTLVIAGLVSRALVKALHRY